MLWHIMTFDVLATASLQTIFQLTCLATSHAGWVLLSVFLAELQVSHVALFPGMAQCCLRQRGPLGQHPADYLGLFKDPQHKNPLEGPCHFCRILWSKASPKSSQTSRVGEWMPPPDGRNLKVTLQRGTDTGREFVVNMFSQQSFTVSKCTTEGWEQKWPRATH